MITSSLPEVIKMEVDKSVLCDKPNYARHVVIHAYKAILNMQPRFAELMFFLFLLSSDLYNEVI